MTPKTIAALALVALASLVPGAAHAGNLRTQFQVSAVVVDSCSVAVEANTSASAPVSLRTACMSGATSLSAVGNQGALARVATGAPTQVSSARVQSAVAGGADTLVVTLSF